MTIRKPEREGLTTQKATPRTGELTWTLVVFSGQGRGGGSDGNVRRYTLAERGETTIGRDGECDIVLDHPSVSRQHVRLRTGDKLALTVEDLGSSNGTRLGGVTLARGDVRPVQDGVSLEIGDVVAVARRMLRAPIESALGLVDRAAVIETPGLAPILAIVDRAALSDLPVLISGETGAGKEHIAARLVEKSRRAGKPFLRVNIAAMSSTLIESELFGHERGAFTGAEKKRAGVFELASTGTLFLDEIGDLPIELQAKLLRVLEERSVWPVGAQKPVPIDVRIIAATHHDLIASVETGKFRRDLYYRLCGVSVVLPPLRQRREDVLPLAQFFAARGAAALEFAQPRFTDRALAALAAHTWPGNARELRFACERAVVLAGPNPIEPEHLQLGPLTMTAASPTDNAASALTDGDRDGERHRIIRALEQCAGNQTQAARLLGISRGTLVVRLDAFNLPRPRRR